jgi:tRNA modification GTPase
MHHNLEDTIIAPATATGEGAIAIVRLSGKEAIPIADRLFFGKKLAGAEANRSIFGTIRNEAGDILDEVMLTLYRGPKSYTGDDLVEISCHASPYIVHRLIELGTRLGARMAAPGEFTMRAYLNGKMDLSQAEAVADLIASESKAGHDLAMAQMRGTFSSRIEELRVKLIDFASLLELELDFSEEDVEFADRSQLKQLVEEVLAAVERLIDSFKLGNVLKKGVPTVISGRPNAGKSTLLNVLLQEDRAIVSDIAGTTRDTIEEVVNIRGVLFRFIDTAGIRETQDHIEATGVKRTFDSIAKASLVLYLFDLSEMTVEEVKRDVKALPTEGTKLLLIANKEDKCEDRSRLSQINLAFPDLHFISISAKHERNIKELEDLLYEEVVGKIDLEDRIIISNARHLEALQKVRESLLAVQEGLETDIPSDLVAMDMRQALYYLGSITGAIETDDLLGNIFGKFCIGK